MIIYVNIFKINNFIIQNSKVELGLEHYFCNIKLKKYEI